MSDTAAPSCPRCQIGHLQSTKATYSYVHNGLFVSVPNMPAWKCDICQYQEFDYDAMIRIEVLVGQLSLPTDSPRPAAKLPAYDVESMEGTPSHRAKS